MKMVISTSWNYFTELHRSSWGSSETSYVKSIWHSAWHIVGAGQKFIFILLSLPPSSSFPSSLPLCFSSIPTLGAACAGPDVNRGWSKLWKLLPFYIIVAWPPLSPKQKWLPMRRCQQEWRCSLTVVPSLCLADDVGWPWLPPEESQYWEHQTAGSNNKPKGGEGKQCSSI